jgi:hypothetical protein
MSNPPYFQTTRFGWLAFPLLVFAASRALLFAFAKSAPLFGGRMGSDPNLSARYVDAYPLWAALGHGSEIVASAHLARHGYATAGDVATFPLLPLLGKALCALSIKIEIGLVVLSLAACAAAFCGLYRLFDHLRGGDTARWGLALLAAFPFAYHLSDGGPLAATLALSTWGVLLVARGSFAWASGALSLAVLAHPAGVFAVIAAAVLPPSSPGNGRSWGRWAALLVAGLALATWLVFLRSRLGIGVAELGRVWVPEAGPTSRLWSAMRLAFGGLAALGVLGLGRRRPWRRLALVGGLQLGLLLVAWTPSAAFALVLCWPAFLGLGDFLAERPALRAPLVAMLGAHQGLLLYGYTHFLRLT